jgi:hypothetical protein
LDASRPTNQWSYTLVNPVPTVALSSPANGTYLLAPANVTLRADATDNDDTIARVEFYVGASKLGEGTATPYAITWTNVPVGTYTLRAVATDNSGLMATSAPVRLFVISSPPVALTRGPYLQSGTPTSGVVRWRTDAAADSLVHYGPDPAHLTNVAELSLAATEHIVRLDNLQPDTQYFYAIGSSSQTLAGGPDLDGANFWFKTSPLAGTRKPTRFWVLGDSGTATYGATQKRDQGNVRDAYYRFAATNGPADLWLMLGDNAYNSGQDSEYQVALFDMYPATLRNLFLWPTIGNHESSQSFTATDFPYLHMFTLPQNGEAGGVPSGTQKYYSFDYANLHFVCLDSMTSGRTTNTAMAQWLREDLAATVQDWTIVYFHHPPYTKGSHNSDAETELIEIRQNLIPILESYGVDLVLSGHSHAHERSYLLNGHYGLSTTLTSAMKIDAGDGREDGTGAYRKNALGQGVVYSVTGSSGQISGGALNHPAHFVSLNELGSLVVDVVSNRLDARFLTDKGETTDHFTLLKPAFVGQAAPIIVSDPASRTNVPGASVSFVVQAAGDKPLAYQWRLNGASVAGATGATLTLGNVQLTQQGAYDVVVTNNFGAVTSRVAMLVLNTPPLAGADTIFRPAGQGMMIEVASLLANDTDPDGDALSIAAVSPASSHGATVVLNGTVITYTPPANFNALDTFTYTLADTRGATATGLVTVVPDNLMELVGAHLVSGKQFELSLTAPAYQSYTLLFAPSVTGPWTIATNWLAVPFNRILQFSAPAPGTSGFYQLRSP